MPVQVAAAKRLLPGRVGHQGRRGFGSCILAQPILLPTLRAAVASIAYFYRQEIYRYAREIAPQPDVVVLSGLSGQQLLNTRRT
ncbi:hypothetical protein [Azohydromonas lata]|uniref:Uncharacterized protein n=1 Tax=Azohydromonas lata TaxID=45677 RepID=A0ABU5IG13_9BURK|nr:hypothetical protein [Azohydromonas lata]MDZ5456888.1 hypothetical protein [Azohydromonas lata]